MIGKTEDNGTRKLFFSARTVMLCLAFFLACAGTGMTLLCGCSRSDDASASGDEEEAERAAEKRKEKKLVSDLTELAMDANKAWSDIDTQLQRRSDLIPNLVETVKGYTSDEDTVFTNIANARSKLAGATTPADKAAADDELSGCLSRLLVIVEQYPELKANENFIRLQDELAGTENRIAVARRHYNEINQKYNRLLHELPDSVRNKNGLKEREYFEHK